MFPGILIQIIVVLLVTGILLWGLSQLPFIDAALKQIIRVLIVVFVAIWLIYALLGAFGGIRHF